MPIAAPSQQGYGTQEPQHPHTPFLSNFPTTWAGMSQTAAETDREGSPGLLLWLPEHPESPEAGGARVQCGSWTRRGLSQDRQVKGGLWASCPFPCLRPLQSKSGDCEVQGESFPRGTLQPGSGRVLWESQGAHSLLGAWCLITTDGVAH